VLIVFIRNLLTYPISLLFLEQARLIVAADAQPENLLVLSQGAAHDEVFAFERCVSRLMEMQTTEYLARVDPTIHPK